MYKCKKEENVLPSRKTWIRDKDSSKKEATMIIKSHLNQYRC